MKTNINISLLCKLTYRCSDWFGATWCT